VPPAYSAIRVDGVRAHELARAGRLDEDLPARPVSVRALELTGAESIGETVELTVRVEASKGYFVRALARDLALALGTVGHLTALRRTRSGAFTVDEALPIDTVTPGSLLPVGQAASRALPVTFIDVEGARAVSFGQPVAPGQMRDPHTCPSAWLDESGQLLAIGECLSNGTGRVLRGFAHGQSAGRPMSPSG
jgi:tRNA pseudouridine55 synthase